MLEPKPICRKKSVSQQIAFPFNPRMPRISDSNCPTIVEVGDIAIWVRTYRGHLGVATEPSSDTVVNTLGLAP